MILALASPRYPASLDDCLGRIGRSLADAAARGAGIVCFPEAYLPGYRSPDFDAPAYSRADQDRALPAVADLVRTHGVATVLGLEWFSDEGRHLAAAVFNADGTLQGVQTKNQLDPSEDALYVPGRARRLFEVHGVAFGVVICHEGFRYPETVRWAARGGARIVFHPHCSGNDRSGTTPSHWGAPDAPYYEKAVMCRALENTIYFASVNYALAHQEAATSLIGPTGELLAHQPYGEEGVLVCEIDPAAATGLLALRYAPDRHTTSTGGDA